MIDDDDDDEDNEKGIFCLLESVGGSKMLLCKLILQEEKE